MQYLSASRIKTLQSCSWKYYCSYILKLPDQSNEGSLMGTLCHDLFEILGSEKHKPKVFDVLSRETIYGNGAIRRYVETYARKLGVAHNMELIDSMIVEGLKYDFFGERYGQPYESHSEIQFDITEDEEGKRYRIMGFIDKLFLFKDEGIALIRDFKSSKRLFEGKDVYDNTQDLFYRLAVSKLFPEYTQKMEFVFLQFDTEGEGLVETPHVPQHELEGFEHFLTDVQEMVDNFDEDIANSNFALDKGYPAKDEGFSGKLMCGRGDYPGHLKKDGLPMYYCPQKLGFEYYAVLKEGKVVRTSKEPIEPKEGEVVEQKVYAGCPKWRFLEHNRQFIGEEEKKVEENWFL